MTEAARLTEEELATPTSILRRAGYRLSYLFSRVRRKLPHLVWRDDEVDVCVTMKDLGALGGEITSRERLFQAQKFLNEMGICFDTGSGFHGRDWEWDFSLRGPISVRFRRVTEHPERRTARPKPKLKLVKP